MALIEVMILDRIGKYYNGQIVEIEEGVFLTAILRGGKAEVINPPDWTMDSPTTNVPENSNIISSNNEKSGNSQKRNK